MKAICIDGGASKVAGAIVEQLDSVTFRLYGDIIENRYQDQEGFNHNFSSIDLDLQLERIPINHDEKKQGDVYIKTIISTIDKLITRDDTLISIAMPGVKTKNKKGISVMANGPRIPNLIQDIKNYFGQSVKVLDLQSDADMCVWGEEYAKNGSLRSISNAYYLGGGTGIADGLKLNRKILSFDEESDWIAKCWEFKLKNGNSLESLISMAGIIDKKNSLEEICNNIGLFLFDRLCTVHKGGSSKFKVSRPVSDTHPFKGILLDRIIIGQRLAEYFSSEPGNIHFRQIKNIFLEYCNIEGGPIKRSYNAKNIDEKIILSRLRESPIIGLGAKACLSQ